MSLKERLTKFATTPGGVIPASPGFMPDDARKVLALHKAACLTLCACVDLQDKGDGSLVSPARLALTNALAAMEAE